MRPLPTGSISTAPRPLEVDGNRFLRDGSPHQIISGAVHYFRVHPDLWEDRLLRLRAMGLNTIETYLPWNVHERRRGEFDFTGAADVARFVTIAGSLGLDVILRPGPYICAEWDFGGLPAWLMSEPSPALRTSDPRFLAHSERWFAAVTEVIRPLLATVGGPVVAVQVENEYGSFGDDARYLDHCRQALIRGGIDVLLLTSDGAGPDWLDNGSIPGVLATANFGSDAVTSFAALRAAQPVGPLMCMEYWNGWFDHWGEPHHLRPAVDAAGVLETMLELGASVNIYMAHGGTNPGLWNGANHDGIIIQPTVTSYDYDAPVGEAGELTAKFHAYREVIARHTGVEPRALPQPLPRLAPSQASVHAWGALLDRLELFAGQVCEPYPVPMERLGQDHGLILYRGDVLVPPDGRELTLDGLADRALVLADGEVVGVLHRDKPEETLDLAPRSEGGRTRLDILVENQGRINYGPLLGEHKGVAAVRLGNRFVHGWESIPMPLDRPGLVEQLGLGPEPPDTAGPVFAAATLEIDQPADGFVALPGWTKGFVWLNGILLGRYWEIGPQQALYAAAPLWRAGRNDVVILELHEPGSRIEVRSEPDLG